MSEEHERYLPQTYFRIVGQVTRNPRYLNKRVMDPQLKCYMDEIGFELPPEWDLPVPNPDAAYKSLAKYGKPILPMTEEQVHKMNRAWEMTARHFGVYMANSRVLSYAEAKSHLDMSTSTGIPFNAHYPTKQELFEKDPDIDEWLEHDWETMAEPDLMWTCVFTNSLKEEIRPIEKIAENSQRTFLSGGVDATVHGTRLFVDQNEKMYASHLRSSSAVGMSPLKGSWDDLYRKLNVFKAGFALDESQYDSSLRPYMMWGCARLRWNMLREQDQTLDNYRRILVYYRNLVHTVIASPDGVLVMKQTGNPSGSVNTISDNTLILYTLLAYAWITVAPKELQTLQDFEFNTAKALVGDDNTWTVSDDALPYYNAVSVIDVWKSIGVTTTTDSLEPRPAKELDFLSAHTVFLKGKAVPLYSRVKLMTSLLYAPRAHLTPAITLERVAAMLSIGWTDLPFRYFCRNVIEWLLYKYDQVMRDDPRWILAKCQIQTDQEYEKLFLGSALLHPQSLSGRTVKLSQPDKSMNSASSKRNGTKPGKKTNKVKKTRASRPRKGKATRVANVGKVKVVTIGKPRQRILPNGNLLVTHREFISKIAGSVDFSISTDPINPGLPTQFKWLYPIAMRYESYRFRKLKYEFINSKAGTFAGEVIMGIDYDPSDPEPFNEDELQSYFGSKTGQICEPLRFSANISMLHKIGPSKFTRLGALSANQDIKLYDSGNFFIATTDCADTSTIGRLFVEYEVELMTPQVSAADVLSSRVNCTNESAAAPLGDQDFGVTGALGVTRVSGTTFSISVPGQYMVMINSTGTNITQAARVTVVSGASEVGTTTAAINAAATASVSFCPVKMNTASDTVSVSVTATTLTSTVLRICPYTFDNV